MNFYTTKYAPELNNVFNTRLLSIMKTNLPKEIFEKNKKYKGDGRDVIFIVHSTKNVITFCYNGQRYIAYTEPYILHPKKVNKK